MKKQETFGVVAGFLLMVSGGWLGFLNVSRTDGGGALFFYGLCAILVGLLLVVWILDKAIERDNMKLKSNP